MSLVVPGNQSTAVANAINYLTSNAQDIFDSRQMTATVLEQKNDVLIENEALKKCLQKYIDIDDIKDELEQIKLDVTKESNITSIKTQLKTQLTALDIVLFKCKSFISELKSYNITDEAFVELYGEQYRWLLKD